MQRWKKNFVRPLREARVTRGYVRVIEHGFRDLELTTFGRFRARYWNPTRYQLGVDNDLSIAPKSQKLLLCQSLQYINSTLFVPCCTTAMWPFLLWPLIPLNKSASKYWWDQNTVFIEWRCCQGSTRKSHNSEAWVQCLWHETISGCAAASLVYADCGWEAHSPKSVAQPRYAPSKITVPKVSRRTTYCWVLRRQCRTMTKMRKTKVPPLV